jgi:tetratricopeptide (TPR) repeat protein
MSARAELGTLEASGLIEIAALQPELEYLFRHALVQEAAYDSLLKQDRRQLHRAAAETILKLHPDRAREFAGVIAMHFEQAGDSARATEYFVTAGDHALERFANREAKALFARADALAGESQVNLRLRAAIGGAKAGWTFTSSAPDIDRLERALGSAAHADELLLAQAYFWIAFLRRQRGERPESSPPLQEALDRAQALGVALSDPSTAALPRALMGSFTAFIGNLRDGAREMREALDLIEQQGDHVSTAMIGDFLAITLARLGEFEQAEATIAETRRHAGDVDHIGRVDLDISESALNLERGEADKASALARDCAQRAEDLGAYACVLVSNLMLGSARLAREDAPAAKAPLERSYELSRVTNMAPMRTLVEASLGSTRALLGDLPGGVAAWDEALANARGMGDRYGEAQTLWGRARAQARLSRPAWPAALADLDRAIELFEEMETRPSLARALRDRAQALRAIGNAEAAAADHQRSLKLARELDLRDFELA